ncbi:MAG: hypothetical protein ABI421_19870 [Polyangiaceae bacterium]
MRRFVSLVMSVFAVALYAACGSDATGIDACRQIETARCQAAPACGISLSTPPSVSDGVDGCISFYKDACLHGLEVSDPGTPAVTACIKAIQTKSDNQCLWVQFPQTAKECAWLTPPPDGSDASVSTVADSSVVVDAATDAD